MKTHARRVRRTVGQVVAVPLGIQGKVGFGLVLEEPLVAFFDVFRDEGSQPTVEELIETPIAFRIWVANQPIVRGKWPVIGRVAVVPPELLIPPWFFKVDALSGAISKTRDGGEEIPASESEVAPLERAAVWSEENVVERLRDLLGGGSSPIADRQRYRP